MLEYNSANKKGGSWLEKPSSLFLYILCLALGFVAALYIKSYNLIPNGQLTLSSTSVICKDPPTRREWRTLSRSQKKEYVEAVQCLSAIESNLGLNQTLHGDFPLIHSSVGNYCMSTPLSNRTDVHANSCPI